MPARDKATKVFWSEQEWEQFAELLHKDNPGKGFLNAPHLSLLTKEMLNRSGAKMPRPRDFTNPTRHHGKLLAAFSRLRERLPETRTESITNTQKSAPRSLQAEPAGQSEGVRWDAAEWEEFAALLHAAMPQRDYLHSPDLATMSVRELNEAGAKVSRPRTKFAAVSLSRAKLLAAYARLRDKLPASGENIGDAETAPTSTARRAPPPAEPPSPLKLDANGRPLAIAPAEQAQGRPAADLFAVVAWDRREWLAIAAEIDRMYPGSGYSHREHLAGLTSEDVAFAQRVLPVERQNRHIKVASFCTLRAQLQHGFRDLKEQRRQQAEAEAQAQTERQAQQDAERHAQEALAKASAPPASVNPYEAAFAPLMDLIVGMLVERVRPMLADAITQALNAPAAASAVEQPSPPAPAAAIQKPSIPREKPLLRIGVLGSEINYAQRIAHEFPSIEFVFVSCDDPRQMESLRGCDYVYVLTKFVNHSETNRVKKMVGTDKFKPVHGAASDLRRLLTGMLNTQPTPAPQQRVPSFAH